MKLLETVLLLTTLAMATTAAQDSTPLTGCIELFLGKCFECYQRHVLTDGSGCAAAQPATDRCQLYTYNNLTKTEECSQCKPGYANQISLVNGTLVNNCVTGTIQDCLVENDVENPLKTLKVCSACKNGKYAVIQEQSKISTCKTISNPVDNCLWGGIVEQAVFNVTKCFRCQPGYASDALDGKCSTAVQDGCWTQHNGVCYTCDPFQGYSIDLKGNCFKSGNATEFSSFDGFQSALAAGSKRAKDILRALGF